MSKTKRFIPLLLLGCMILTAFTVPAADTEEADYDQIKSDLSGMTEEIAGAYLAVMDDLSAHIGTDEAEDGEGEYLHGGFVRDWDGDGIPELCLILRTSPRDSGNWDGTPVYGWYPPTMRLYTYRDGQAEEAGECDLYFGTAGREAAVAALTDEDGMQYVWWDHSVYEEENIAECFELANGTVQKCEVPDDVAEAAQKAGTADEFLDCLGEGRAHLLLCNNSGDSKIEGEANAQKLREILAGIVS